MDSELSEEFEVKVGMCQGSVLSPFFVVVVNVITDLDEEAVSSELMYVEDLVLVSEIMEGLSNKFLE